MKMNDERHNEADRVVSDLLAGLPRMDAPANFHQQVRARIAAGRPQANPPFWSLAWMKVAVPLILMLFVGVYLFVQRPGEGSAIDGQIADAQSDTPAVAVINDVPVTQGAVPETGDLTADSRLDTLPKTSDGPLKEEGPRAVPVPHTERNIRAQARPSDARTEATDPGGSVDRTVRRAPEPIIITPDVEGGILDPREVTGFEAVGEFKPADVLRLMGIRGEFGNGGWRVTSVEPLSSARRSGVQADDIVEAIDGVPLGRDTVLKGKVTVNSLQIRRGEERRTITLEN